MTTNVPLFGVSQGQLAHQPSAPENDDIHVRLFCQSGPSVTVAPTL